jgi:hypothetical protein
MKRPSNIRVDNAALSGVPCGIVLTRAATIACDRKLPPGT